MIFDSSQREEREHRAQTMVTSSFEFEVAITSISLRLLFFSLFVFFNQSSFLWVYTSMFSQSTDSLF